MICPSAFPKPIASRCRNTTAESLDTVSAIVNAVCQHFSVTTDELDSHSRALQIVWPRMLAMFLVRSHTDLSLQQIAVLFNRTHGAILNAVQAAQNELTTNPRAAKQLAALRARLSTINSPTINSPWT